MLYNCCYCTNDRPDHHRWQVMSLMATECQEQDQSVDLSGWRSKYDCQVECPGGAVFHECNQRNCEVTCNNMKNPNACPRNAQLCYPGCVCPDGLVPLWFLCILRATFYQKNFSGFSGQNFQFLVEKSLVVRSKFTQSLIFRSKFGQISGFSGQNFQFLVQNNLVVRSISPKSLVLRSIFWFSGQNVF